MKKQWCIIEFRSCIYPCKTCSRDGCLHPISTNSYPRIPTSHFRWFSISMENTLHKLILAKIFMRMKKQMKKLFLNFSIYTWIVMIWWSWKSVAAICGKMLRVNAASEETGRRFSKVAAFLLPTFFYRIINLISLHLWMFKINAC